jgi:hypothetical protein
MILVVFILRAVRKTVAGRGVDTILIGLPAQSSPAVPEGCRGGRDAHTLTHHHLDHLIPRPKRTGEA